MYYWRITYYYFRELTFVFVIGDNNKIIAHNGLLIYLLGFYLLQKPGQGY